MFSSADFLFIKLAPCVLALLLADRHGTEGAANMAKFCLANEADFSVGVNITYGNCYHCGSRYLTSAIAGEDQLTPENCTAVLTDFDFRLYFINMHSGDTLTGSCSNTTLPRSAEERSLVNVTVMDAETCVALSTGGVWPYTPLLVSVAILLALAVAWVIFELVVYDRVRKTHAWRRIFGNGVTSPINDSQTEDTVQPTEGKSGSSQSEHQSILPDPSSIKRRRLASLDAFRGLSLVAMIFVNYGGGGYWFFQHSTWNGLTVADLVFPWFVFILGTSAAVSLNSLDRHGISRRRTFLKVIRRFVILFGLGLLLNKSKDLSSYRVMGVLQRLAICYLIIALLHLILSPRARPDHYAQDRLTAFRDLTSHILEWSAIVIIISLHTLVTFLVHKEECPQGYLGAGGALADYGKYINCTGGAAGYIDQIILHASHLFQHPTCKDTYLTGPFEPEGILSSLTAIVTAFLGMHAGRILIIYRPYKSRLIRFLGNAGLWACIAIALCEGKQNGGLIPINKNLWSLSYSLSMSSSAFFILAVFYYIIDVKKVWNGTPLIYPGKNSILIYVGHEVVSGWFPFDWSSEDTHTNMMARNVTGTALWVVIAYYLHTVNFFLKI